MQNQTQKVLLRHSIQILYCVKMSRPHLDPEFQITAFPSQSAGRKAVLSQLSNAFNLGAELTSCLAVEFTFFFLIWCISLAIFGGSIIQAKFFSSQLLWVHASTKQSLRSGLLSQPGRVGWLSAACLYHCRCFFYNCNLHLQFKEEPVGITVAVTLQCR